jgi:hypothetical protein
MFLLGLSEEQRQTRSGAAVRKKPGVRIAGHSETSILGHPGRFELPAASCFLAEPTSIVYSFFKHENAFYLACRA